MIQLQTSYGGDKASGRAPSPFAGRVPSGSLVAPACEGNQPRVGPRLLLQPRGDTPPTTLPSRNKAHGASASWWWPGPKLGPGEDAFLRGGQEGGSPVPFPTWVFGAFIGFHQPQTFFYSKLKWRGCLWVAKAQGPSDTPWGGRPHISVTQGSKELLHVVMSPLKGADNNIAAEEMTNSACDR